jgi:hypothetical protein
MKKILALIMSLVMALSLVSCSTAPSDTAADASSSSQPAESQAAESSSSKEEAPAEAADAAEEASENQYFESLNAADVNIQDTGIYVVQLKAKEGWQFDVADGTDVTSWLVNANGEAVIDNTSGVAIATNGTEEFTLDITIDASKITGFTSNGSGELYVMPVENNPLVVEGDNHGQYNAVSELVGTYTIPEVQVLGTIEGDAGSEYVLTEDTVTIALVLDGLDDSLIDSANASLSLAEGDGYYLNDYAFNAHELSGDWENGETTYTMTADDLTFATGGWSPLGGDGNGNYYCNIAVDGLTYNGLPLTQTTFRAHVYSYGRTFTIESNGSLIDATQPVFTCSTENGIPVLCDAYPDYLNIKWPVDFDASSLTTADFTLTLQSQYGDELTLEADKDFTMVSTDTGRTELMVSYIYWANIPVYTTMKVDVATDNLTWDEEKYTVDSISYSYDIASVYAYYIMTGGMSGTQAWTYYGLDGLTDWAQAFYIPHYTLTYTAEDGTIYYYAETENGGKLVTSADEATQFDASEDCNAHIEGTTGYFTRVYDQTAVKTVDGEELTFDKSYDNADNLPLSPEDCTGITAQPGYVIGDSWEVHGRWPWQTFVNTGYQGGHG